LVSAIGIPDSSIAVTFYNKVTSAQLTPDPKTKLFVIDKGSANQPNVNYEIVLCASHSTTNGVTTLTGVTRGLAWTGTSLAAGTGKSHVANAEIGPVDVHYLTTILAAQLDGTDAITSALNFGKRWVYSGTGVLAAPIFADATARDAAITAPQNGDIVYNTAVGLCQKYVGGAWVDDTAGGAVPNASETVAGKIELATNAEMGTATSTGGTGARLVPPNDQLVKTSSGAGDANKIPVLDNAGALAGGFLPTNLQAAASTGSTNITGTELETLSSGADASALHTHGAISKSGSGTANGNTSTTGNIDINLTPFSSSGKYSIRYIIKLQANAFITVGNHYNRNILVYDKMTMVGEGWAGFYASQQYVDSPVAGTTIPTIPVPFGAATDGSMSNSSSDTGGSATITVQAPTWSGSNLRFSWSSTISGGGNNSFDVSIYAVAIKLA
jgi:hypothetical protein